MNDKLIVKAVNSDYEEPLNSIIDSTFQIEWAKNDSYQMQFAAYSDNSIAFETLGPQASVFWNGQEYIIKQAVFDFKQGQGIKSVIAVHVYTDVGRIYQRQVNDGVKTYSIDDVLAFFLGQNDSGYTYQVIGDFSKEQIENLGACSGKGMLSKIKDTWPDAVIFPDNKCLKIYNHDSFVKDLGNRIDYLHDTNEVQLTYDCTNLINKLRGIGKPKDEDQGGGYYFDPFFVQDDESIKNWGVFDGGDVSDERFTDANTMKPHVISKMSPEPITSIAVTENTNQPVIPGEIRRLEVRPQKYVTNVEVVAFTIYPKDKKTPTQITLNNKAMNILKYNNRMFNKLATLSNNSEAINSLKNSYDSIVADHNKSSHSMDQMQKDINWLTYGQVNLVLNGDLHVDNTSYFEITGKAEINHDVTFNGSRSIQLFKDSTLLTNSNVVKDTTISARVSAKTKDNIKIKLVFYSNGIGNDEIISSEELSNLNSTNEWTIYSIENCSIPQKAKSFRLQITTSGQNDDSYFSQLQINNGYKLTDWNALIQPKTQGE